MPRSSSAHTRPRETRARRLVVGARAACLRRAASRPQTGPSHRAGTSISLSRPGSGVSVAVVTAISLLLGAGTGWSYWSSTATGQGTAGTATLTAPAPVAAAIKIGSMGTVVVSWTASIINSGPPEGGYRVIRFETGTGDASPACGTSSAQPTTTLTCEEQPQPDGVYRYRVVALHHTWTAESELSDPVTVDTSAPHAPTTPHLVATSDSGTSDTDGVTSDATPTFTGSAEAGSLVSLHSGGTLIGVGEATGGTYSITIASALAEGQHTVTATATDALGNISSRSEGLDVTIDTVQPTVTVARAPAQPAVSNTQPLTFVVSFSEPVTGFTAADVGLTAPAGTAVTVTGSGDSYTIELRAMSGDGTVTVALTADAARDLAGNGNTAAPAEGSITWDSTAPTTPAAPRLDAASDTGSSSTDGVTNDATPVFTGVAEPGSTVTLYEGDTALGAVVAGPDGLWTITSSTLAEGSHIVSAGATDAAGNASARSAGTAIAVDVTAPAAPSAPDLAVSSDSGSSSTDNYTNDATPTFSGTGVNGTTVTLHRGGVALATFAVTAGTYTFTTAAIVDGLSSFTAIATDVAGNSSTSAGTAVTVDTTAPTVSIGDVVYNISNSSVTTTGTAGRATGDPATTEVVICSQNVWPCSSINTVYTGTPSVSPITGAWIDTSRSLGVCLIVCIGPGQIYVRATQTDLAGNVGISGVVSRYFS